MEENLHGCLRRHPPAVSGAGGHHWLRRGSSCCVSQGEFPPWEQPFSSKGEGRSVMAGCQQGALEPVFWSRFLSCKPRLLCVAVSRVVHAHLICRCAGDRHVGRLGCSPAACPRLTSGWGHPGCACLRLCLPQRSSHPLLLGRRLQGEGGGSPVPLPSPTF